MNSLRIVRAGGRTTCGCLRSIDISMSIHPNDTCVRVCTRMIKSVDCNKLQDSAYSRVPEIVPMACQNLSRVD